MTDHRLSERLARIARDIQSGKDVSQAADEVVVAARDLVRADAGVGITLAHRRRRLDTVASTSDVVRQGDQLQYELREGPCVDAVWDEELVHSPDLATDDRWPSWAPRVAEGLGVRSMLCVQLFTNEQQLGALNLYASRPGAFDDHDVEVARILGAHAAVAVAAAQEIQTLKVAVDRRTTIGKALGILMVTYEMSDDQALSLLRRISSQQNRRLYELAEDVVAELGLPRAVAASS